MKKIFILSVLMTSFFFCNTAVASDITGKYICKDAEGSMIIKKFGGGYTVEIFTYETGRNFWSGFEGQGYLGYLASGVLTATQTIPDSAGDSTLQISVRFSGNIAKIEDDDVVIKSGSHGAFDGPSGGPGFNFTYKKK